MEFAGSTDPSLLPANITAVVAKDQQDKGGMEKKRRGQGLAPDRPARHRARFHQRFSCHWRAFEDTIALK
jgi:hypothetical protein